MHITPDNFVQYFTLALNIMLIPACKLLWDMSRSLLQLEIKVQGYETDTHELKTDMKTLQKQMTDAAIASAAAAATAAQIANRFSQHHTGE